MTISLPGLVKGKMYRFQISVERPRCIRALQMFLNTAVKAYGSALQIYENKCKVIELQH